MKYKAAIFDMDGTILNTLDDLADTMYYDNRGVGIAAPQVGVLRRVFIVDVGDDNGLIEFINPEIIEKSLSAGVRLVAAAPGRK